MRIDYSTPITSIRGEATDLNHHHGKVMLIVNTASKCGFTPQYAELERLWQQYKDQGLVVLGFPCNQFANQEPGSEEEIAQFCSLNYGITFPMHSRIDVNGAGTHPLFKQLKAAAPGVLGTQSIKWNFTKFLVDRNGNVVGRYSPNTPPGSLAAQIEKLLHTETQPGAGQQAT